jgi:hypothetical protein
MADLINEVSGVPDGFVAPGENSSVFEKLTENADGTYNLSQIGYVPDALLADLKNIKNAEQDFRVNRNKSPIKSLHAASIPEFIAQAYLRMGIDLQEKHNLVAFITAFPQFAASNAAFKKRG